MLKNWQKHNPNFMKEFEKTVLKGGEVVSVEVTGKENTPMTLKRKVIKGGSWKDVAYFIQNGSRTYEYQDTSKSYVGFRCIQTYIGRSNKDRK
jgi:formylglycine-generating enzyme required for sulfatase activity